MITVFKDIRDSKNPHIVKPELIYSYIRDGRYKDKIESLRTLEDKKERDKIKATLPSICWSGEFTQRGNDFCKLHSGYVCVDFDHVENLESFKKRICEDQYTYICFVSPSGDGLKVIIKIPANISTHADSCRAITEYYSEDTLDEFRDIARVCYISYDKDIYINPNSKIFSKLLTETNPQKQQVFYPTERLQDSKEIYDRIVTWLETKETYIDGNKHNYLVKLASACLRFGINQMDCSSWIYFNYSSRASKVSQTDIDKIVNRIYTNFSSSSCTAHFEQTGKPIYTATKKEVKQEIFDIDIHSKDIIYLDNVKQSMFDGFKTGKSKGSTTYFETFDNHWTWRRKELTYLGGIGNMGKTIMWINLCVLKAKYDGWKFAVFSPEQDPPDDFYNDLIHTYVGKSTEPFHKNQMTDMEYKEAMRFIEKHFFYIFPEDASPTPEYINSCFEYTIKKHKVDCCIIDPFNQLDNDWRKFGRDDLYISEFLSKNKRFSQDYNIAYLIAGHPNSSLELVNGNYSMPTVYKYAGGAMWNNKCDNILCYHRPYAITEPTNTECFFVSQKIKKRKLTGVPGQVIMNFDIKTNRFSDINGNCPFENEKEVQQAFPHNNDLTHNPDEWLEPRRYEDNEAPF
jgi:hypothetical protein